MVSTLASPKDFIALTQLLDTVTLHLLEKKIHQWEFPWDPHFLLAEIQAGRVHLLWQEEQPVATYSLRPLEETSWLDWKPDDLYLYRIALAPSLQGRGLGQKVLEAAIEQAGPHRLVLDCWSGNLPLRRFYTQAGFSSLGDFPEEDYQIHVFCHTPKSNG